MDKKFIKLEQRAHLLQPTPSSPDLIEWDGKSWIREGTLVDIEPPVKRRYEKMEELIVPCWIGEFSFFLLWYDLTPLNRAEVSQLTKKNGHQTLRPEEE